VVLDAEDHELVRRDLATDVDAVTAAKLEILAKLPAASAAAARPRIRLAYKLTPHRIVGTDRATGIEFRRTGTDEPVHVDAGLVLTSIGYRGKPIPGLPFDEAAGVVPNEGGRVIDPADGSPVAGSFVAGWIKRGPTGFIGTNKSCAMQTVSRLVDDFNDGLLTDPVGRRGALQAFVRDRRPEVIDAAGWRAINAAELRRGEAGGRPRVKFTAVRDMMAAAAAAPEPSRAAKLVAGLRR